MNRILLEVAKAIETGTLDTEACAIVLSFIVEKRHMHEASADEHVALAEVIRRALVDADSPDDLHSVLEIIEGMQKVKAS